MKRALFLSTGKLFYIIFVLFCFGCATPGFIIPSGVDIYKQEPLMAYYQKADLSISPFLTRKSAPVPGMDTARMFAIEINRRAFFKNIHLIEDELLLEQIELEQDRIDKARLLAQKNRSDMLLYGTVEEYIPATVKETRLKLDAKLIRVSDGELLWWGSSFIRAKQGGTFLFWGRFLSPKPPSVEKLMTKAVKKITSAMIY